MSEDTAELLKQADILAGMLRMGERIEFGRDADMIERLADALKESDGDLQEALRRYDERNRTAQDRAVSNGLKLERIAELESELAGCRIALEQAWESNRIRENEIRNLMKASRNYQDVTKEYFSDTEYDRNGMLADADAELHVLIYDLEREKLDD